ncbi:hypothetical protein HS7_08270 [Sulfolobales archaeon HS-7]|nr:hypothetical protein HS7_08270 [Sulfolobales archaeon HS-7]
MHRRSERPVRGAIDSPVLFRHKFSGGISIIVSHGISVT